jgi:glycosyltransferase involved in cell wall biosynthesis
MDIGYLLNSRIPSDNAHVIQSLQMCDGFVQCGYDVTVLYPNRTQVDDDLGDVTVTEYYDIDDSIGFASFWYPDINAFRSMLGLDATSQLALSRAVFSLRAATYARRFLFDIHYTRGLFVATLLVSLGLPTVLELHEQSIGAWGRRALARIGHSQQLRGVVTLTDPARESFVSAGVPAAKVTVVPDGVDLSAYEPNLSKAEARRHLDLDREASYVGYTGSLTPGKGVRTLVDACAELPAELLVVGGREDERDRLRRYLEDNGIGNVRLVGQVEPTAVPAYQRAADVLALPPRADVSNHRHNPETTSPLKMFEYMAAERPIVATKLPGITDVLTDEEHALLVPPGDAVAMRQAIDRLLSHRSLGESLAARALGHVESFTWRHRCERILDTVA